MKKLIVSLCVGLLIIPTIMSPNAYAADSNQSKKMIVIFADGKVNKDTIIKAKGQVSKEYEHLSALAVTMPESSIKALEHEPGVIRVEPDFEVKASGRVTTTTVPPQTTEWGVSQIAAPNAWAAGNIGTGVKVAVIDTGIASHPDLTIAGGVSLIGRSYADDNGHGTHVAGIIAAKNNTLGVVGVAPNAQLFAVKVLDRNGSGYTSNVVAGIDWAITNHMDIINMSLGSPSYSLALDQVAEKAYTSGIVLVAAAGNDGVADTTINNVGYPAKLSSVIAVAATDINNSRAYFSSTGDEVEVSAPGVNIKSTYLKYGYITMSGTSMATPMVAGDLALLKQANPTLTNFEIRDLLDNLPADQRVIDLGTPGRDAVYGYGLIQAR